MYQVLFGIRKWALRKVVEVNVWHLNLRASGSYMLPIGICPFLHPQCDSNIDH